MADPVSWLLIEPGWKVMDAVGEEVGRVEEVLGDSNADIFDGLSMSSRLFARTRYVPAELVGAIEEGVVHLTADRSTVEALGEFKEPPVQERITSESSSGVRRLLERLGLAGRR
jgi:hypothetical protein